MDLANGTLILVADGNKALFLRNEGDAAYPNLAVERKEEQDNPPTREQAANRRGRVQSRVGSARSAYDDTDWHELAEERFAADLAEILNRRALRNDYEALVIVADPVTLGQLRPALHKVAAGRLVATLDKDLTGQPLDAIEERLKAA